MRVFLTGFMGAGKSTVGRLLADHLGCEFADLDRVIERAVGKSIPDIFADDGEAGFRSLEAEHLEGFARLSRCVVATGGGTPLSPDLRRWMRSNGSIVWLDVPFESLAARIESGGERPLWGSREQARRLLAGRRDAYRDCDLHIDAGERPAAELAESIAKQLRESRLR